MVGCSSAANLDGGQAGETDSDALGGFASGESLSASQGDSGTEGTSEVSGGSFTTGGDDPGPATTSSSGELPAPPSDEPAPSDEKDPQNVPEADLCGGDQVTAWRLAARDPDAMSSPAHAREAMLGPWPSLTSVAIRPWEFLNYYTFAYPLAPPGELLAGAQLRASKDDLGDMFELQVAIRGPELAEADRPPVHLTLALDNSGSMEGKALELLKTAGHVLAGKLRAGDTVAVVSWNQADAPLLPATMVAGPNDPKLLAAIDGFTVGGSAELTQALSAGYAQADMAYVPKDINRLILISDGGATATQDDLEEMAKRAGDVAYKTGVHAIGVGVGDPGLYRSGLIDAIGVAGAGPSIYVGSTEAAEIQLGKRFLSLVGLTASTVDVRVTLPPGLQLEPASAPDAEAVGQDHVTAAPTDNSVVHRRLRPCVADLDMNGVLEVEIRWADAVSGEPKQTVAQWKLTELLSGETAWLQKGEAVLAYAAALRAIQYYAGDTLAIEQAWERLEAAKKALPDDPELAEIGQVLAALQEP
ncbi:von Willebrand factor type A domain-containing protein [Nannocystis exedens]|uniref:von Willebrand factor type A domain-containing protein n=1 Tax=Nannocystis exedens TaxID=54 RepID=A0A1I1UCY0_9BACT|nr:VWA domain-containing protein [Nannocystis exedens]PCC71434.1 putative lipoprotein [Nannocystis exedens]SFD65820.1 von Willebrand factor type A domain-containing protein [Nannocystis exedens]